MCMKLLAVMLIVTPLVLAQSKEQSSDSHRWSYHKTQAPILPMDQPSRVSGAGVTTPSGVRYWDIQIGGGNAASKGHVVKVLFRAWTAKGQAVDSVISERNPVIFTLGVGQVIPGWEEGMEGMKVGGRRQLRIPPEMAYGAGGVPPIVPSNSTLIFDVELVGLD